MARVKVVGTGGTIANTDKGRMHVAQLLTEVPQVHEYAELETEEVLRQGSESFTEEAWLEIGQAVWNGVSDPKIDGVVVTHGTFTAEETAFFLQLTIRSDKPVAIACAQRRHGMVGNDGDRNLIDAVRVAASSQACGKGVFLVMAEEIHSARDVIKSNQRPGGFISPGAGPLGHVEIDQVTFDRSPTRRHTHQSEFHIYGLDRMPRVDIAFTHVGADDVPIRAMLDAGARGIVVHGFAYSGKPTEAQMPALLEAEKRGIPVVTANRGGRGRVPRRTTNDPVTPFIKADSLIAQKARILLMLGLGKTRDFAELQRMFDEY